MIIHGSRVAVFDHLLFKNDVDTPLSHTVRPATVVCRYGRPAYRIGSIDLGPYPDLIDVVFDHRPDEISHGHFTENARPL